MENTNAPGPVGPAGRELDDGTAASIAREVSPAVSSPDLSPAELERQAVAFLDFESRSGLPRMRAWAVWCGSKDFTPLWAWKIRVEVQRQRVVRAIARFGKVT